MTQKELEAGKDALRNLIRTHPKTAAYASFIGEELVDAGAYAVIEAVDDYRKKKTPEKA